ncbi:MAG TPA: hypothetical protein VMG12_29870 [Polyangiaceae bacterium]|nr:hypothetical protein [Polyangiaceae bacterium]
MRTSNVMALFCAACIAGATACSDADESTGTGSLTPFAGAGGVSGSAGSAGSASSAGAAGVGVGVGGSAGSNAGGSGGNGAGGSGGISNNAGAAGTAGAGGSAGAAGAAGAAGTGGAGGAGDEPGVPDAGAPPSEEPPSEEPPPEDPPPDEDVVGFSDVYSILVTRCGQCHSGNPAFLPAFAQPDQAAASALVQPGGLADRIYARTVTDRTMPPACRGGDFGDPGCATEEEAALLQEWADGGYQP